MRPQLKYFTEAAIGRILYVNLGTRKIEYVPGDESLENCGRTLALKLLKKYVPAGVDYLDDSNAIVITPGLLSGTPAPGSGRFTISAGQTKGGLRSVNLAGPFANRLASLDIAALVIHGESTDTDPLVIHLNESGAEIIPMPLLRGESVSGVIHKLRGLYPDAAVTGCGPAGERVMPLAAVFSIYPSGRPEYYCARGGMGDIFGIKGVKAIVAQSADEFANPIVDRAAFTQKTREINSLIREHPVCGKALPSYGSITLMQMLRDGRSFDENASAPQARAANAQQPGRINRACTVNCPIRCLNRNETTGATPFNSPFDSEAFAACKKFFVIEDQDFVLDLNKRCFDLGVDSIEFLATCALILKIQGEKDARAGLTRLADELAAATPLGRIVGSATRGVHALFADHRDFKPLVTRAATSEHARFQLKMPHRVKGTEELSDLEYLYSYILASQNIGLCLFTTFAMLDNPDGLAKLAALVSAKTGQTTDPLAIIRSGYALLCGERAYELASLQAGRLDNIPEFVKVLYRYFGREKQGADA